MMPIVALSENRILTSTISDSGMMFMGDTLGNVISSLPTIKESSVSDMEFKVQGYLWGVSKIVVNKDCNKFLYSVLCEGLLCFGEIKDDSLYVVNQKYFGKSKIQYISDYGMITFRETEKAYALSSIAMDDYVAILYSGRTRESHGDNQYYGRDILIYSWDGKPYQRIITDIDICNIMFDSLTKTLYGLNYNPEASIVSFDLSDVL